LELGKDLVLSNYSSISESVFAQARSLAVSQGTSTRVVIHAKLNDTEDLDRKRYRKMLMIMQREVDPDTGELRSEWVPASQPTILPDQVYYAAERSKRDIQASGEVDEAQHRMGRNPEDEVNSYYYEFNSQGICTTPGASFILEAGARPPNSERAILGTERSYGGFVVARNGGLLTIRDITKIDESL